MPEPRLNGERLRRLRKRKGLSAERLGWRAKVSGRHVQRLEKGERGAGARTLARLALALGTTSEYLLGITDDDREIFMLTGESRAQKDLGVVLPARRVDWGP